MAETSRDTILQALRAKQREPVPLPDLDQPCIRFDDPVATFAQMLEAVGGRCLHAADWQEVNRQLDQLPAFRQARLIGSSATGIDRVNFDVNSATDPHELAQLDFYVATGQFAVAENGAVWVTSVQTPHRALFFIVQHLALIVPADQMLHNLHEAYERLRFDRPEFGLFLSGPSKTADIEQSLVIGAHGARSLTVFLLGAGP
jgi:L-lactate dehydrogenase complex protein LldG